MVRQVARLILIYLHDSNLGNTPGKSQYLPALTGLPHTLSHRSAGCGQRYETDEGSCLNKIS